MKMKKIMFTASGLAVGTSLLSTVLTSCSAVTIDEKLKITLDDEGYLSKGATQKIFNDALKDALSRSSNWAQFKAALADELVFQWYQDRAAETKDSNKKNTAFRVNLDEWKNKIDKEYDETIKSLKNKYKEKWEFYLQNETLAPYSGSVDVYKHVKLVEKAVAEFKSKVFATNYFGIKTGDITAGSAREEYPNIYTPASLTISEDKLKDPQQWKNLGFFARTNPSFGVDDTTATVEPEFLAKNPDGDYATIQSYVFDRWFATEKPFFSAAALFKYSNPLYVAESKLSEIYNGISTGVKIPDKPSEAFPFFGGCKPEESGKGTVAYKDWWDEMKKSGFDTVYKIDGTTEYTNGTISIPKSMTEDSQTLLLCFGSQMIGGSANALYIPYANAAASLFLQMIAATPAGFAPRNTITADYMAEVLDDPNFDATKDSNAILRNFMFKFGNLPATVQSYLDLTKVYHSGLDEVNNHYHCPLFKENSDYTFLYGTKDNTEEGVAYVTNTVQVKLGKGTATQPWILELNEAGMHAQTIDGYQHVANNGGTEIDTKLEALKEVVKYRLMQKKCGHNAEIISCDVFGDSGKLKSYFNDNFANIILELAMKDNLAGGEQGLKYNVFRPISSYSTKTVSVSDFFLGKLEDKEKLGGYTNLADYIKLTTIYDRTKKIIDAFETANNKTFAYRTKQMENARTVEKHLKVYENGLLAPIPYLATSAVESGIVGVDKLYVTSFVTLFENLTIDVITRDDLKDIHDEILETDLLKDAADGIIKNIKVNTNDGWSPQVRESKDKKSNRAWYKSYFVDKMMYQYMSNKEGMANSIKGTAMQKYFAKKLGESDPNQYLADAQNAIAVTYDESKIFTNNRNYSNYGLANDTPAKFFENIKKGYASEHEYKLLTNGAFCDEYLNDWIYKATLAYLIGNPAEDSAFENFYKILNAKISEDEMALVGYINKDNRNVNGSTVVNAPTDSLTGAEIKYDWSADVNNIFDETGYSGRYDGEAAPEFNNAKIASDQYWKVINKDVGPASSLARRYLAGFTGIQTKSSNQLDSASKLQAAAFEKFAKCSDGSKVLSNDDPSKLFRAETDTTRYAENYGCWFAYAGVNGTNGQPYTFKAVDDKAGHVVSTDDFKLVNGEWSPALKLGKKIAELNTPDDLRALAKKLGDAFYGDSIYREIGDRTEKENDVIKLKLLMLDPLIKKDGKDSEYLKCFQRMTDAELHEEGSAVLASKQYGFTDDKGNTYRILFTQINKADVTEKKFAPKWENGAWKVNEKSPIQIEEFWYILANMATESSVQQLAIADVVKEVFGPDKLVVYDAELYNCFDSVWIKDWSKKTMGA